MSAESLEIEDLGITLTVMWEDPRYPILTVDYGGGNVKGYSLKDMHQVCICNAYEPDECGCGAWDGVRDNDWEW